MAQETAWRAGLPANPPEVLAGLLDKRVQRRRLRAAGLITPAVRELPDRASVADAQVTCDFPAVLKPAIGMGSAATFRIASRETLLPAWGRASQLTAQDPRIGFREPVMLLEQELRGDPAQCVDGLGDYMSVECMVLDGEVHVLTLSDKLPLAIPFRENGHILPAIRTGDVCEDVREVVLTAHRALGVRFGVTHTEVKLTPAGPAVIEMNGRVGGGVTEMLSLSAGYDLPLNLARLSVGGVPETVPRFSRWSTFLTPQPPEGRHEVVDCLVAEEVADIPGVAVVQHVATTGTILDSEVGTASNVLKVVAVTDSPEKALALAERLSGPDTFRLRPVPAVLEEMIQ